MNAYGPENLSNAVAAICPDVQARVDCATALPDERCLWWELSSCILSSQVPYALAVAATDAIDAEGLMLDKHHNSEALTLRLVSLLSTPLSVEGRPRAYRFPVVRARQLAATRDAVTGEAGSLHALIEGFNDATEARAWLVKHAPGIGPKQASMFLRNVGVSYDLAILDRHVLNYMAALGIYSSQNLSIGCLAKYHKHEAVLRDYADGLDCPVGLLDWAIWIVMRVASQKIEPVPT
jgi:N-glycosylase/DNA lyase